MIKRTDSEKKDAAKLAGEYNNRYAAEVYGVHPRTLRKWRKKIKDTGFEVEDYPVDIEPIGNLINTRVKRFKIKKAAYDSQNLINIRIKVDGPIGIAHFGDPHIDDDGTDISELLMHAKLVKDTDGMFGGNVGDIQNNWIGRLARLYGEQSTSAKESWRLSEHFISQVDWLYLVGGNHDAWSGSGDPLEWIMSNQDGVFQMDGARLNLIFPNKKEVRINIRHDFAGHSMWNTAHGVSRAAQMGWRDHILTCGHKHVSGYQVLKCPASGIISHALRIGSYTI